MADEQLTREVIKKRLAPMPVAAAYEARSWEEARGLAIGHVKGLEKHGLVGEALDLAKATAADEAESWWKSHSALDRAAARDGTVTDGGAESEGNNPELPVVEQWWNDVRADAKDPDGQRYIVRSAIKDLVCKGEWTAAIGDDALAFLDVLYVRAIQS